MRFLISLILSTFFFSTFSCATDLRLKDDAGSKSPARYEFATQTGGTCLYFMAINHAILEDKEKHPFGIAEAFTKREWLGRMFPQMRAISEVEQKMRSVPAYVARLKNGVDEDSVGTMSGKKFVSLVDAETVEEDEDTVTQLQTMKYSPFTRKTYKDPSNTPVMPVLPIHWHHSDRIFLVNERGEEQELKQNPGHYDVFAYSLTDAQKQYLGISNGHKLHHVRWMQFTGGFFPRQYKIALESETPSSEYLSVTTNYDYGSYLMMLNWLGLNSQGDEIDAKNTSEDEIAIAQELQKAIKGNPKHPWNNLKRDNFLEAQLIQMLKKDPKLQQAMRGSIDVEGALSPWAATVASMDPKYFTQDGQNRREYFQKLFGHKDVENNIPLLAFKFSQQLNALWAAGVSYKAFTGALELNEIMATMPDLAEIVPALHQNMVMNSGAFVDVFQEVRKRLDRDNYMTFYGHGNVVTFNPLYLELQHRESDSKELLDGMNNLARNLGVSKIDSTYHDSISPWYQHRRAPETAEQQRRNREVFEAVKKVILEKNIAKAGGLA